MGRKANWLNAMKKALHPESKEKSNQERTKSKKKWFRKKKKSDPKPSKPTETTPLPATAPAVTPTVAPPEPPKLSEVEKDEKKQATNVAVPTTAAASLEPPKLSQVDKDEAKQASNVVLATDKAADEAPVVSAPEVVRLTTTSTTTRSLSKSKEEVAAIKIQTAFRGYMARRILRALRGLMRLKTTMQGHALQRQTKNTLKSMQTLARVQCRIREIRLKQAQENQACRRKIQQKYEKDQEKVPEKPEQNDGWDSSGKTRAQIEAKVQSKHEAAIRRERTMAYAYSHQKPWKPTPRPASTLYMDAANSHWGWSWLERWLAARPWEDATVPDKDFSTDNSPRVKDSETSISAGTEKPSPTSSSVPKKQNGRLSTSSAPSKALSTAARRHSRSPSPMASPRDRSSVWGPDDDARSMLSLQSEQSRRNSGVGSYVTGDDESQVSGTTVPSYMAPTESARAKSRDKGGMTPDRLSVSSAKKRMSYSPSPVRSRPSTSSIADHHT